MAGIFFNENDFFMCSGGLFPAQFAATSHGKSHINDVKFLTIQDKVCRKQDFSCKWIVVLAAAIAALCVTGVGAMLVAALIGAVVGLGLAMSLCGAMASMARTWLQPKVNVMIGGNAGVTHKSGPLMVCSLFGGKITHTPNITAQWQALLIGGTGTVMAGLEGFMYASACRGAGTLLRSPATFFSNFGSNYVATLGKWGLAGRGVLGAYSSMQHHYVGGDNSAGGAALSFGRAFAFELDFGYRLTQGDVHLTDLAMILGMGGIPAVKKGGGGAEPEPVRGEEPQANREAPRPEEEGRAATAVAEEAEAGGAAQNRAFEDPQALRPNDFGYETLSRNPDMLRAFNAALKKLASSKRNNLYKEYLSNLENGTAMNNKYLSRVWDLVRGEFKKEATKRGITVDEGEIHHWNYPKYEYPDQVANPDNLVQPVDRANHEAMHEQTTSNPLQKWEGPIDPRHELPINSHPVIFD